MYVMIRVQWTANCTTNNTIIKNVRHHQHINSDISIESTLKHYFFRHKELH